MPVAFVPLELSISEKRSQGIAILMKEDLQRMNKENEDLAIEDRKLSDFLQIQHVQGKVLYFNLPGLKDFIIIQPTVMVNVLKAFVTDRIFWPKDHISILNTLTESGKINKDDLFILWSQEPFNGILPSDDHKEYMVKVLVHLDILVRPTTFRGDDYISNLYLVPCMVKSNIPDSCRNSIHKDTTISLTYILKDTYLPIALAYTLIGATTSIWPFKKDNQNRLCLYARAAIMNINDENELYLFVDSQHVEVHLHNKTSTSLISPDIASSVQECLTHALTKVLEFYYKSSDRCSRHFNAADHFTMKIGFPCNQGAVCTIPIPESDRQHGWTCQHRKNHQLKYPLYWIFDKVMKNSPYNLRFPYFS